MKTNTLLNILILFALSSLFLFSACATTSTAPKPATPASAGISDSSQPPSESMLWHESDIRPFAARVEWPQQPQSPDEPAASVIKSGVNDDGVWLEGKGFFKGNLDYIYQTLTNPEIMGPTYLTKDITQLDLKSSPVLTTFTMHVKMRYIMSVEFDIGVTIDALYDANDHVIGYRYKSRKVSGTRFIDRIDETIVVKQLDETWFSVEFQSLNEATMNKEEETRKHLETLFDYWTQASGKE